MRNWLVLVIAFVAVFAVAWFATIRPAIVSEQRCEPLGRLELFSPRLKYAELAAPMRSFNLDANQIACSAPAVVWGDGYRYYVTTLSRPIADILAEEPCLIHDDAPAPVDPKIRLSKAINSTFPSIQAALSGYYIPASNANCGDWASIIGLVAGTYDDGMPVSFVVLLAR